MMAGGVADLLHVFCDASNWCFQTVIELSTALFYYTKREGINFVAVKYDEIIAGVYYLSISLSVCVCLCPFCSFMHTTEHIPCYYHNDDLKNEDDTSSILACP